MSSRKVEQNYIKVYTMGENPILRTYLSCNFRKYLVKQLGVQKFKGYFKIISAPLYAVSSRSISELSKNRRQFWCLQVHRPLNFRKCIFLQSQSTRKQVTYLDEKTVGWQRYQIFLQIILQNEGKEISFKIRTSSHGFKSK